MNASDSDNKQLAVASTLTKVIPTDEQKQQTGLLKKLMVTEIMSIFCTYLLSVQMNSNIQNDAAALHTYRELMQFIQSFLVNTMSSMIDSFISIEKGKISIHLFDDPLDGVVTSSRCFCFPCGKKSTTK